LYDVLKGVVDVKEGRVTVLDAQRLRGEIWDRLVYHAVFGSDAEIRGNARWLIKSAAAALGVRAASIQSLYEAMGRGEAGGFTVPAINIRGMTYDVARSIVRAAMKNHVGAFIFEIARSEIGYTFQNPAEYAVVMLAAAVREGYVGPVFIQGDHFQANAKKYTQDPEKEVSSLKKLIGEAVGAGFYNIDIDTSTLVDLDKPNLKEQQRLNFELAAQFTAAIRNVEPAGVTVSVGGEIGEVGGKNSTVEELRAFMDNYKETLAKMGPSMKGISKISVQTGTSHGGVPLPDGTVATVKLDFDVLERISKAAREDYHLSGAVQHGASTLPEEAFHRFPETGTSEVHLATEFQNMIYQNPAFPQAFREEIYGKLRSIHADEKKSGETDEQFIYKTRKKGFGHFKEKFWSLPESVRGPIGQALEAKFSFLFGKLRVVNTADVVNRFVKPADVPANLEWEIQRAGDASVKPTPPGEPESGE
jgi:fructose/tagatose bisphosphate aldolase